MDDNQNELGRLESIISQFTISAQNLIESDHKKTDMIYDFLFVGQPTGDPPVPPFVSTVQNNISQNSSDIKSFKTFFSRLGWSIVTLILAGAGYLLVATIIHISQGVQVIFP